MKKIFSCLAVIVITAFFMFNLSKDNKVVNEYRGIFISYIEYIKYFKGKSNDDIKKEINNIIDTAIDYNFNIIYLQVRPFSDSIYDSKIFPFSHTVSGSQGKSIGLDLLEYFIKYSHDNNIKIYAWINPYRISNDTDISFLSNLNPAYKWLDTNNISIIEGKGIFYNPASNDVRKLIISGVREIVENYKVDGVLFDDYFYPNDLIDLENYKEYENDILLTDFRLNQINELIINTYKTIKEINSDVLFGIAPDGNIDNNYNIHYADIKTWLKEDGYIDYIMPQIYYGFLHDDNSFIETTNDWNDLIKNKVKLIPVLALYKSGEVDVYAKGGKNEWIENDDIIKKQIQVSRNISNYYGFSIFRYDYLVKNDKNVNLQNEINNFYPLFIRK